MDKPIEHSGNGHHNADGHSKAIGCFDFVGTGEIRTHPEKVKEKDVLDEYRLNGEA
jgi:hypothetical protein